MEIETLILIALRQSYMTEDASNALLKQSDEIGKMLSGLRKSLK